jgi:hypothetical protein
MHKTHRQAEHERVQARQERERKKQQRALERQQRREERAVRATDAPGREEGSAAVSETGDTYDEAALRAVARRSTQRLVALFGD